MERYLSCGETIAAWKSMECIIGAAVKRTPGAASSLRFVITNLMRSPTRARSVGPGTWSPKVQALNFTPGAISMILCVVSRRTVFMGAGSSGWSFSPMLSAAPSAKAPWWRSEETFAAGDSSTIDCCAKAARSCQISEHHLAKVVHFLGAAGWLENSRGRGGGMRLALPASEINLGEVVKLTEGTDIPAECFESGAHDCVIYSRCRLRNI